MPTISSGSVGTISSAGIGSGLDVNTIVDRLMGVERLPLNRLQSTASSLQTTLSAFGQIQSLVSAFQDAARPLYKPETFTLTNASSTDPLTVSAGTSGKAVPGSYAVSVTKLAAAQSITSASGQFADATGVVGSGSITISLGAWNAGRTAFTPKTGAVDVTIPIDASAQTLGDVRDKINAANAGVSATIVTDATGSRLALTSTATGESNGFRVSVADDDGNSTDSAGLSRLAYDPSTGPTQTVFAQAAANTEATVNGIAVSTSGTSLDGVIEGLTLNLGRVTTQPVTVNVTRNTDAIKTYLQSFVTAYNVLNSTLAAATKYDPATKTAALLQGDGTTTGIVNQLHTLIGARSGASAAFATLSAIGVQVQKDGTLKLDEASFGTAATNLPQLTKALSNVDDAVASNNGFGKRLADWADGLLKSGGALPGKAQSIQARIDLNRKQQDTFSDRLTATEQRLRAQYTALDSTMSRANALASYVKLQFYTLKQNSNSDS